MAETITYEIKNQAFVIDQIKQLYAVDPVSALKEYTTNAIDSSFIRLPYRSKSFTKKAITALHLTRREELLKKIVGDDYRSDLLFKGEQELFALLDEAEKAVAIDNSEEQKKQEGWGAKALGDGELVKKASVTRAIELPDEVDVNYNNDVQLSEASGNIFLTRACVTDFGVSQFAPLNISMFDGATITQGNQDTTLKSCDIINVVGRNNKIVVTETFTIDGKVLLDDDAELIICFESKTGERPKVVWSVMNPPTFGSGNRIEFRGHGIVEFEDGNTITFAAAPGADRPLFVVNDSASLRAAAGDPILFDGNGVIMIDHGAELRAQAGSHFIFGNSIVTDRFDILVDRGAVIRADALDDLTKEAKISFQHARYTIDVEQGSSLSIGNGGVVEFNALNGEPASRGHLESLTFNGNGIFEIATGGTLIFARNVLPVSLGGGGITRTAWNNLAGRVVGGGVVQLGGTEFAGLLQEVITSEVQLSAEEFVHLFANTAPGLAATGGATSFASALTAADGTPKLRLRNGLIVDLLAGDEIRNESASGLVYGVNSGKAFHYDLNGVRS